MKVMLNLPGGEGKLLLVKYIGIVAVSNVSGINSCTEVVLLEQDMETVARGSLLPYPVFQSPENLSVSRQFFCCYLCNNHLILFRL